MGERMSHGETLSNAVSDLRRACLRLREARGLIGATHPFYAVLGNDIRILERRAKSYEAKAEAQRWGKE